VGGRFQVLAAKFRALPRTRDASVPKKSRRCSSTAYAPWHVVPANKKWYRDLVVARTIADTLEAMAPEYRPPAAGLESVAVGD
jgi:Polyphosphate kinase 2 (PPK2)